MEDEDEDENIYMKMPLPRVIEDARHGVSLARQAWRRRDPALASRVLGFVVEPSEQAKSCSVSLPKSVTPSLPKSVTEQGSVAFVGHDTRNGSLLND